MILTYAVIASLQNKEVMVFKEILYIKNRMEQY